MLDHALYETRLQDTIEDMMRESGGREIAFQRIQMA